MILTALVLFLFSVFSVLWLIRWTRLAAVLPKIEPNSALPLPDPLPRVSLILPVRNEEQHLARVIGELQAQSLQGCLGSAVAGDRRAQCGHDDRPEPDGHCRLRDRLVPAERVGSTGGGDVRGDGVLQLVRLSSGHDDLCDDGCQPVARGTHRSAATHLEFLPSRRGRVGSLR